MVLVVAFQWIFRVRCSGRWLFASLPQDLVLIWPAMNEIFNIKFPQLQSFLGQLFIFLVVSSSLDRCSHPPPCKFAPKYYRSIGISSQPHALIYPIKFMVARYPILTDFELRLYQSLRCSSNVAPFRRPHPSARQFFRSVSAHSFAPIRWRSRNVVD